MGSASTITRKIPTDTMADRTSDQIMTPLGFLDTRLPNAPSKRSRSGFLSASLSDKMSGFGMRISEMIAGIKKRLAISANIMPKAAEMPSWPAGIRTCPRRQSMPAIVVIPVSRIGFPRLLNILFANSFFE